MASLSVTSTFGLGGITTAILARSAPDVYTFVPGVRHGHAPAGDAKWWAEVQNDQRGSISPEEAYVRIHYKGLTPKEVMQQAVFDHFEGKPIALKHLRWYLTEGDGETFVEDDNVALMLRTDGGVRRLLKSELSAKTKPKSGIVTGHTFVSQQVYDSEDLQFAFGALDRLDFEADFNANTFRAWFLDRYEFHPVYPKLYAPIDPLEERRFSNLVHAAAVELKLKAARDYWMMGAAKVSLDLITKAPAAPLTRLKDWKPGNGIL